MSAVRADDEIRAIDLRAIGGVRSDSDHASILVKQFANVDAHLQLKAGRATTLVREHFEKCRLRDELACEAELRGVEPSSQATAAMKLDGAHPYLRQLAELFAEPHLRERVDPAGLQSFAAKGACKVPVFF